MSSFSIVQRSLMLVSFFVFTQVSVQAAKRMPITATGAICPKAIRPTSPICTTLSDQELLEWGEEKARLMEMWHIDQCDFDACSKRYSFYSEFREKNKILFEFNVMKFIPEYKKMITPMADAWQEAMSQHFDGFIKQPTCAKAVLFSLGSYVGVISRKWYDKKVYEEDASYRQVPECFLSAADKNPDDLYKIYLIDPSFALDSDMPLGLKVAEDWEQISYSDCSMRMYKRRNVEVCVLPFYFSDNFLTDNFQKYLDQVVRGNDGVVIMVNHAGVAGLSGDGSPTSFAKVRNFIDQMDGDTFMGNAYLHRVLYYTSSDSMKNSKQPIKQIAEESGFLVIRTIDRI